MPKPPQKYKDAVIAEMLIRDLPNQVILTWNDRLGCCALAMLFRFTVMPLAANDD